MDYSPRHKAIIEIIASHGPVAISGIKDRMFEDLSIPTLNRELAFLVEHNAVQKTGKGRATAYRISPYYQLFSESFTPEYFDLAPDSRGAKTSYNIQLLELLKSVDVLTKEERKKLEALRIEYQENLSGLSSTLYQKELERLTIELSWKSSQIEGNTYSLLETERLFREKEEAPNKSREEAIMLLNHKKALDYILENKDLAENIDLRFLEEIHSMLIKDLDVGRNIRKRSVGITGSAYSPLDNEFQIRENLQEMCDLINHKKNGFEKALLSTILISYIQPFEDGNKRTGRMISNALLIAHGACPLSYRSVDSIEYKKAMLLFYEQNNIAAFKDIFMQQVEFAVRNYFR